MKLKKTVIFILFFTILSYLFIIPVYAEESITGKCGKNAFFSYSDGVLTISGTGATYNYTDAPTEKWAGLKLEIKKIVVEEGITRIGDRSFVQFSGVKEVVLPESLKEIGYRAFQYCENLETANVAEDVTCETAAFSGCNKFHPLQIITQPSDYIEVENAGDYAVASIEVVGDGISYQWYYSEICSLYSKPMALTKALTDSAKTANYKIQVTEEDYGRSVECRVYDRYGRYLQSETTWLKFKNPYPTIVSQPSSITVAPGETARIHVEATGCGLKYKWYYKNANMKDFQLTTNTTSSYSIEMTDVRDGREMYCIVYDVGGRHVTTDTVTLHITSAASGPDVSTQPKSTSAIIGENATICVEADGEGLTYTWYYKNPGQKSFCKATATQPVYSIKMTEARDGRQMYCKIKDAYGHVVQTDTVTLYAGPNVITQPQSVSVLNGKNATISVKATGRFLKYTWYYKNPDQKSFCKTTVTKPEYSIKMTEARDGRQMYCRITDAYGQVVKTDTVTLNMKEPPSCPIIVKQPQSVSAKIGETVTISVEAEGEGLTYIWYYQNEDLGYFFKSNATGPTYSMKMTEARDGRQMYCKVINKDNGSTKTEVVTLTAIK